MLSKDLQAYHYWLSVKEASLLNTLNQSSTRPSMAACRWPVTALRVGLYEVGKGYAGVDWVLR